MHPMMFVIDIFIVEFKAKAKVEETGISNYRHKCTESVARSRFEEVDML